MKLDSVRSGKNAHIDSASTTTQNIINDLDSTLQFTVSPKAPDTLRLIEQPLSKIRTLQSKLDSLNQFHLPESGIKRRLDSLKSYNPVNKITNASKSIDNFSANATAKVQAPIQKVNQKLDLLSNESEGLATVPGNVHTDKINIPGVPSVPSMEIPADIPGTDLSLPSTIKVTDALKEVPKGNEITTPINSLAPVSEDISSYASDLKDVGNENLDQKLEETITENLPGQSVADLESEFSPAMERVKDIEALNNKEGFKKHTIERARRIVFEQIAQQQVGLQDAVNKVSKYQQSANPYLSKIKDLPKRPRKIAKPPLIERFVPSITMQLQRAGKPWHLDINPSFRYKVRSIYSIGFGWTERIAFNSNINLNQKERMYGLRAFNEFVVKRVLAVRGDIERMNAFVPVHRQSRDIGTRKIVWSYMLGLKKQFSFYEGILANVQFMYNLYDPEKSSPYFSRINVRFGFEFPMKRTRKK